MGPRRSLKNRKRQKVSHDPSPGEPTPSYMSALPTELVLKIFEHLPAVTNACVVPLVCERWNLIHTSASLYRNVDFTFKNPSTKEAIYILRLASSLQTLTLENRDDANAILATVGISNPTIKSLSVINCNGFPHQWAISGVHLNRILRKCTRLEELRFSGTCTNSLVFYLNIGASLPELRSIQLPSSMEYLSDCLPSITLSCARLEHVRLFHFGVIDEEDVIRLCDMRKDTLKTLVVNAAQLSDLAMARIATCRQLTSLKLHHLRIVSDAGLRHIGQLTNLNKLLLSGCWNVTSTGFLDLLNTKSLQTLEELRIYGCNSFNNDAVDFNNSLNLKRLFIFRCPSISLKGWRKLFAPEKFQSLALLKIRHCSRVDDDVVSIIQQNLKNLREVYVHGCPRVTWRGRRVITSINDAQKK